MDAKTRKRVAQCNFSYFSAIAAPDADPEGLRILCDWGNWVSTTTSKRCGNCGIEITKLGA